MLEGWRLACLGGDLTRREEAGDYCGHLLAVAPDHPFALLWAQVRGFPGDLTASVAILRGRVLSGEADAETCTSLFSLLNARTEVDALAEVVAKSEPLFAERREVWQFWAAEVHVARGETDAAFALADSIADVRTAEVVRRLALRRVWRLGGSAESLTRHLEEQFATHGSADVLFELCELHSQLNDWKALAKRAEELVRLCGTVAAMRLAAAGAWNAHDHRLCLRLLRENQHLFPDCQLPPDLERYAVLCETQCGLFDDALAHARRLVSIQGELQDVALQFNLEVARGDLHSAALTARGFKNDPRLPASDLLRAAKLVRHVDAGAARELLSAAVGRGARDAQTAMDALVLSHELGLRQLVPQLEGFLHERLETGELRRIDESEVREQVRMHIETAEEATRKHACGELTIHVLGDYTPRPMAYLFHRAAEANRVRPDPLHQEPILAWHGSRQPLPRWMARARLHLDLTGLLAAADLEILDLIEAHLAPLYLAPAIPHCLLQQLERTKPAGAIRVSSLQKVMTLHEVRRISSTSDETAKTRSADEIRIGLGCLDLLTESEMTAPTPDAVVDGIARDSEIVLAPGAAELLANNGLLERAASAFRLRLPCGERNAIAEWLREYEQTSRLHDWINHLREQISRVGGPYRFFAVRYNDGEDLPVGASPDIGCLFQIFAIEEKDHALVWCDDRYLNSFAQCNGVLTVTLLDVLDELHRRGAFDDAAYYEKLYRLRAGNARYVPLGRAELSHHVRRARVEDGALVETPELSTLRQYYAACLLDTTRLQRPAPSAHRPPMGEIQLFADLYLTATTTILNLWSEPVGDLADAEARATWVLTSLWQDAVTLVGNFSNALEHELEDGMFGMTVSHLLMQAITLAGKTEWPCEKGSSPRQHYFSWLDRLFSLSGRERQKTLAAALRRDFEDRGWLEGNDERTQLAQRDILGTFFEEMPHSIRDFVRLSPETMRLLGLERYTATQVGDFQFDYRVFWRTAERAWRGRPAQMRPKNSETVVTVSAEKGNRESVPQLVFTNPNDQRRGINSDSLFTLLDRDPSTRRKLLDHHRDWFDCDEPTFRRHADRIAALRCTHERIRQTLNAREASPLLFYRNLTSALGRGDISESPFLPPPVSRLLAHLRLRIPSDPKEMGAALDHAARTLLGELGLEEAIGRLSGLPVAMPESTLRAFDELTSLAAEALLKRLEVRLQQPFARLLISRLWLRHARRSGVDPVHARRLAGEVLADTSAPGFEALTAIVRWTVRRISEREDDRETSAGAMLAAAWSHAAEVFNLLATHDPRWDGLRESFNARSGPQAEFFFAPEEPLSSDAAHPRSLDRTSALIHACAATVLAEDPSVAADFGITAFAEAGFFVTEEGRRAPQIILREEPGSLPNSINSFLGDDRGVALAAAVGEENAKPFLSGAWHEQIQEAIATASGQPPGTGHWSLLSLFLATRPAPERFRNPLGELLCSISLQSIDEDAPTSWQILLIFCARQAREIGGKTAVHIQTELVGLARKFSQQPARVGDETKDERTTFLLEAARHLALSANDRTARARSFAATTDAILKAWPACAPQLRRTITFLSFRLPPREASELRLTRTLVLAQPSNAPPTRMF